MTNKLSSSHWIPEFSNSNKNKVTMLAKTKIPSKIPFSEWVNRLRSSHKISSTTQLEKPDPGQWCHANF